MATERPEANDEARYELSRTLAYQEGKPDPRAVLPGPPERSIQFSRLLRSSRLASCVSASSNASKSDAPCSTEMCTSSKDNLLAAPPRFGR